MIQRVPVAVASVVIAPGTRNAPGTMIAPQWAAEATVVTPAAAAAHMLEVVTQVAVTTGVSLLGEIETCSLS